MTEATVPAPIRLMGWEPLDLVGKSHLAWGQLAKLAAPVLQMHWSDLAHDLDILRAACREEDNIRRESVQWIWSCDLGGTCMLPYDPTRLDSKLRAIEMACSRRDVYDCRYFWVAAKHSPHEGTYYVTIVQVAN